MFSFSMASLSSIDLISSPLYGDIRRIPAPLITVLKGKEEPLQCVFLIWCTESNKHASLGTCNVIWGGGKGYAFLCNYRLPFSGVCTVKMAVTRCNHEPCASFVFPEFKVYDVDGSSSNLSYWHRSYWIIGEHAIKMLHELYRACPVFTPPAIDTVVLKGIEQSEGSFVFRHQRLIPIDDQPAPPKQVQDGAVLISADEAREKLLLALNGNEQRLEEVIVSCYTCISVGY